MEVTIDDLLDALAEAGIGTGSHRREPSRFALPIGSAVAMESVQALALVAVAERLDAIYHVLEDRVQ